MGRQKIQTEPRGAAAEPAAGFSLVEALVAMAVLTVALLGVARLAAEGVRLAAEGTRLNRSLEVIDDVIATADGSPTVRGCAVSVDAGAGTIAWRWIEVRCTRAEAAAAPGSSGAGRRDLAAGEREVGRRLLVPW